MSSPCQNCRSDSEMDFQHDQMGNYPPLHLEGLYLYGVGGWARRKGGGITAAERLQEVWKF